MDKVKWIVFGAICVIIIGFLYASSGGNKLELTNTDPNVVETEGEFADRIYGNPEADVVLFEYADFQCPGCAGIAPVVRELADKYSSNLAFVFRHYPLTSSFPNSLAAASAVEAAGHQDKFYEMSELVYANQNEWSGANAELRNSLFDNYAESIGLDIDKFREDISSDKVKNKIERDRQFGRTVGVNATPTFVLDGEVLQSDQWDSLESLEATILNAFEEAGVEPEPTTD